MLLSVLLYISSVILLIFDITFYVTKQIQYNHVIRTATTEISELTTCTSGKHRDKKSSSFDCGQGASLSTK